MNEEFISTFVNGMMRYLSHIQDIKAEVGTPYLIENADPTYYDITGIIGVSGKRKGCVHFTAPRIFLSHLLTMQGINNLSKENLLDLAGEIANTISGNARADFGEDFQISVPIVVEGKPKSVYLPETVRSFTVPVTWQSYTPLLIVSLEE